MSEARILLTGFEPFGGELVNPSWEVAQALDGQQLEGARVVARCLPCAFGAAEVALREALRDTRPELVLALGQAGGRCDVSVERVAINCIDARIADNAGEQPVDLAVVAGGPAAYFATLPIKAIVAGLRAAGYPASVSQTAGTFVCNAVFYGLMHELHKLGREQAQGVQGAVRAGFIHIPYLPEQAARHPGQPSLPLSTLIDAVRLALTVARQTGADLSVSGGTIS